MDLTINNSRHHPLPTAPLSDCSHLLTYLQRGLVEGLERAASDDAHPAGTHNLACDSAFPVAGADHCFARLTIRFVFHTRSAFLQTDFQNERTMSDKATMYSHMSIAHEISTQFT